MNKRVNFIFPAAGKGQRFKDIGELTPKPLLVAEKIPLLLWAISNFPMRITDLIWVISLKSDGIRKYFEKYYPSFSNFIRFIEIETVTNGPAETVLFALRFISAEEPIIIANTDQYIFNSLSEFVHKSRIQISDGRVLTMTAEGNQWSYLTRDAFNNVNKVVEKKQISDEATVGVYSFSKSYYLSESIEQMIKEDDRVNGEFYIAPAYNYLIRSGRQISADYVGRVNFDVMGTGTPKDLQMFKLDPRINNLAQTKLHKFN